MQTEERQRARELRAVEGASIKEIGRLVGVSRSSVSLWVRDIELTDEQHEALRQRNPIYNPQRNGRAEWAARCRAARRTYQDEGRSPAQRGDAFHAAGCMLYWAEGSKGRNVLRFSNSNPHMLRFFLEFLRTYFDIEDEDVRVWCNLYAEHEQRQREIELFWLEVLDLPAPCLRKSTINSYSKYSRRKRLNALPYGTCRVGLGSTRIVQSIFGSIQYAGFEHEAWLG